jgi:hypothetical protein
LAIADACAEGAGLSTRGVPDLQCWITGHLRTCRRERFFIVGGNTGFQIAKELSAPKREVQRTRAAMF